LGDWEADYVVVVEDSPVRFGAEYPLPVIFWPKLTHAAVARSLCDSSVQYNRKHVYRMHETNWWKIRKMLLCKICEICDKFCCWWTV